jgi:hypothetical protein
MAVTNNSRYPSDAHLCRECYSTYFQAQTTPISHSRYSDAYA